MSVPRDFIPAVQLVTRPRDKPINATTAAIPTAIPRRVKPVRTGRRLRPRVITSKKVISCVPGKFCGIAIENNLAVLHLDRTRRARRNTHIMSDEDQRHATVEVERGDQIEYVLRAFAIQIAGGFIGQKDRWRIRQASGNRDALALAAGKFRRKM